MQNKRDLLNIRSGDWFLKNIGTQCVLRSYVRVMHEPKVISPEITLKLFPYTAMQSLAFHAYLSLYKILTYTWYLFKTLIAVT